MTLPALHPVAQIYLLSTLDCLVEVALAVAKDQTRRPERYGDLDSETAQALADLREGQNRVCPDLDERTELYETISGRPKAALPPLAVAEWAFRDVGVALVNAKGDQRPSLARSFVERSATLRSFLEMVSGSAEQSLVRLAATFEPTLIVLRSPQVARAFGLAAGPSAPWPFDDGLSPAGAQLVEIVSGDLEPAATGPISQYEFLVLQRLARHRGTIVHALMEGRFEAAAVPEDLDRLVAWQHALDDFRLANVARAWRGEQGALTARPASEPIPKSPVDVAVLSPKILEFISSCAEGT